MQPKTFDVVEGLECGCELMIVKILELVAMVERGMCG